MSAPDAYARAGVSVAIEAQASRIMYEASKRTFENRKGLIGDVVLPFDDFSGLRAIDISKLPAGSCMSVGFDTAGTKVELAQRVGKHDTIAFDVLAMVCDDALVRGGEPALVGTNLDLKSLGSDERFLPIVRELAAGYVAAANEANVAIINGEIVQMGALVSGYGEFPYHWGAACVWFARKEKLFTGSEMRPGDAIVALREEGFRCNGWTLLRKIFSEAHGERWHDAAFEGTTLGLASLTPSRIYSRFMVAAHGGFARDGFCDVRGVAHVTGGGVREKMIRILRAKKLGARLHDLFDPPAVMAYCQKLGGVSDADAYGTWNMGQGLLVVTPQPEQLIARAQIEGIGARIAGEIVAEPTLTIVSKGVEQAGQTLVFDVE
jgi:phosphoribosylformylglycinamidine cyclo-ligase